jgi:hypothetical protein
VLDVLGEHSKATKWRAWVATNRPRSESSAPRGM